MTEKTMGGQYGTEEQAARTGKRSGYCKTVGGFAVARMSGGGYDWFPAGQPPHAGGEVDPAAEIVSKLAYSPAGRRKWREIA